MLKFLRKYNKYLLAFFTAVLMVVFLLDTRGCGRGGGRGAAQGALGTLDGRTLQRSDLDVADAEVYVLERGLGLGTPLAAEGRREHRLEHALAWLLLTHDARAMGLWASDAEVEELVSGLGLDEAKIQQLARASDFPPQVVRPALRQWLIAQQYASLAAGLRTASPLQQMKAQFQSQALENEAARLFQQALGGQPFDADTSRRFSQTVALSRSLRWGALPMPRLSRPLLAHYFDQLDTTVGITLLPLTASRFMDAAAPADPALVQQLFDQYKGVLPGQGQPYGFGYRFPDRLRLEYLSLPIDRLVAATKVDEVQVLDHYEKHKADYVEHPAPTTQPATQPAAPPRQLSYQEAAERIRRDLRRRQAQVLGDRLLKEAQALLLDNARGLKEEAGYRVVPADWKPAPLPDIARQVEARNPGIQIDVVPDTGVWLDRDALAALPDLGEARLLTGRDADQDPARLVDYALSAREFKPADENPLITLRLQVGLPSVVLADDAGSRYLVRLTAAEPAHDPDTLEDVRPQVERHARQLASYRKLQADKEAWLQRLRTQGLDALGEELGIVPAKPEPFARRTVNRATGQFEPPVVRDVGQSAAFVDAVFASAQAAGTLDLAGLPLAQRTAAIAVDSRLTLCLVRLDTYEPATRSRLESTLQVTPDAGPQIDRALLRAGAAHPLSLESLVARTGFKYRDAPAAP